MSRHHPFLHTLFRCFSLVVGYEFPSAQQRAFLTNVTSAALSKFFPRVRRLSTNFDEVVRRYFEKVRPGVVSSMASCICTLYVVKMFGSISGYWSYCRQKENEMGKTHEGTSLKYNIDNRECLARVRCPD